MEKLELAMREAMVTGDWTWFDLLRALFEKHMRGD